VRRLEDGLDKSNGQRCFFICGPRAVDRNGPYLWMSLADQIGIEEAYKLP
jgi:hypothetical protein